MFLINFLNSLDSLADFEEALIFQNNILEDIIYNKKNETIWFLEHKSVYTAGRSSFVDIDFRGNIDEFDDKNQIYKTEDNIKIININRGGKITYHGPGQLIIYVFLNLKNVFSPFEPDIKNFISMLENWIVKSLEDLSIKNLGLHPDINRGVWLDMKKLCSIGISLKKWVSYHGISININPDMDFFKKIIACGVRGYDVTSLEKEEYKNISKNDIVISMQKNFFTVFKNYYQYKLIKE
jgi:lipoyl(octanoyl) transferase